MGNNLWSAALHIQSVPKTHFEPIFVKVYFPLSLAQKFISLTTERFIDLGKLNLPMVVWF